MGEQGGPYLTSGLKHSIRKGKGRIGDEKSLSKFRMSLKPPFTFKGSVWPGTYIFSGPVEKKDAVTTAHLYPSQVAICFKGLLIASYQFGRLSWRPLGV